MTKFKKALLASLIVASPLVAAPAFASSWEVYSGGAWVNTGTTASITGPTTATVAGIPVPCTANFTLSLTGGVATVSAASFSGSTACAGITAGALPWAVSSPTASGTSVTLVISGIQVSFTQPAATCTGGTANGTLTNANPNTGPASNNFTFTATFPSPTACSNVRSNGNLVSSKPLRGKFP